MRITVFLAEMRRHELYIENYCTSRVILHEAQPSAIFLYECNNFRYTTKCKSHFCFISYLGERTKVKKKIDLKIKTIFLLLLPILLNMIIHSIRSNLRSLKQLLPCLSKPVIGWLADLLACDWLSWWWTVVYCRCISINIQRQILLFSRQGMI